MALAMQRSAAPRQAFGAKPAVRSGVRVARSRASAVSVRADGAQVQASILKCFAHPYPCVQAAWHLTLGETQVDIDKPLGLVLEQSTAPGGGLVVKVGG